MAKQLLERSKKIGTFPLGLRDATLFWRLGTGGEFYGAPGHVVVGIEEQTWQQAVGVLLHEATELVMTDIRCRYDCHPEYSGDHASYLFVMTHEQFAEVTARVAWFVAGALPALSTVYKRQKELREKRAKDKGKK